MLLEQLRTRVRELMSRLVCEGELALGMRADLSRCYELLLQELLSEVFELPELRNLNDQRPNFPGLDLADDNSGVAFQVTATGALQKIKDTLSMVISKGLHEKYPHVRVFVTTQRKPRYRQKSIDLATKGKLRFDASRSVLDFYDLAKICDTLGVGRLRRVVDILEANVAPSRFPELNCDLELEAPRPCRRRSTARRRPVAVGSHMRGTLVIGYSSPAIWLVRYAIEAAFARAFPYIHLVWYETPCGEQLGRLRSGKLDIAIRWNCTTPSGELDVIPLLNIPLVVLLRADNPKAVKGKLSVQDLCGERFVLPMQSMHPSLWSDLRARFATAGAVFNVANQARSSAEIVDRVLNEGVCAFLPGYPAASHRPGIVCRALDPPAFRDSLLVAAVCRKRDVLVEAFAQCVRPLFVQNISVSAGGYSSSALPSVNKWLSIHGADQACG